LKDLDIDSFLTLFDQVLKDLNVISRDDMMFTADKGSFESVYSILNYKMGDIFKNVPSKKSRVDLLFYDANFKN